VEEGDARRGVPLLVANGCERRQVRRVAAARELVSWRPDAGGEQVAIRCANEGDTLASSARGRRRLQLERGRISISMQSGARKLRARPTCAASKTTGSAPTTRKPSSYVRVD